MAIVKMKQLRAVGMRSEREDLLRVLQRLGCVEIGEPAAREDDPLWSSLVRPDGKALADARERRASVTAALDTLKHYGPKQKGGFFTPRPVVGRDAFFNDAAYSSALTAAGKLNELERRIASLRSEQSKLSAQKLALAPWLALDLPLETESTRDVTVLFATVPAVVPADEMEAKLHSAAELSQLIPAGADREFRYFVLLCHKSEEERAIEVLKEYGYSRAVLRGWTGTAAENDRAVDKAIAKAVADLSAAEKEAASYSPRFSDLRLCLDRTNQDIAREEARCRLLDTSATFLLEGWVPAEDEPRLVKALGAYTCAWETTEPVKDDYPQVPVKLKNNWLTRPLNMVTEMYSLPAYGSVDPNPLMAPFFILFYGIMLADVGYGLLMIIASLLVTRRVKPKGTAGHLFSLMGLCGVSTLVVGGLTGGFFGDFIPQLLKIINPASTFVWFWPPLFTPLDDTLVILIGAMALGFVQILTGMAVSFVKKLKAGQIMDAVWEELTWWLVFAGAALAILGVTPILLIVAGVMVLAGAVWNARDAKGIFGKIVGTLSGIFGSLYNHVTGYFGDILSYSRLMALMLAGSVIAQVFNTLGAIPGNIVIFLIVSLAGNALNFGLNLLGCYVHDLRLQCLEYFGKFYEDGGKPFKPLETNTKFVDIAD